MKLVYRTSETHTAYLVLPLGAMGGGNFMVSDFEHGWSKNGITIFDAETLFSFSSLYSFFPAKDEPTGAAFGDYMFQHYDTKCEVVEDMHDIETWKRNGLGIYAVRKKQGLPITKEEEAHLKNALASAKQFRETYFVRKGQKSYEDGSFLAHDQSKYAHLDIICYGSNSFQNTHCGWHHEGTAIMKKPVYGPGDGTVMEWAWKLVPGGLPFHVVESDSIHIELMRDPKLIQIVARMLGCSYKEIKRPWPITKIQVVALLAFIMYVLLQHQHI